MIKFGRPAVGSAAPTGTTANTIAAAITKRSKRRFPSGVTANLTSIFVSLRQLHLINLLDESSGVEYLHEFGSFIAWEVTPVKGTNP